MKHNFIKAAAVLISCGLFASSGFLGIEAIQRADSINGRVALAGNGGTNSVFVQADNDNLSLSVSAGNGNTENFFADYQYNQAVSGLIAPGYSHEGSLVLTNNNKGTHTIKVYLYARATATGTDSDIKSRDEYAEIRKKNQSLLGSKSASELATLSKKIVQATDLVITDGGSTVYKGKLDGSGNVESAYLDDDFGGIVDDSTKTTASTTTTTSETTQNAATPVTPVTPVTPASPASGGTMTDAKNPIYLGKLKPGESKTYKFTLKVPTSLGNEYSNSVAMIDWVFMAVADDPTTTTQPTDPPPTTTTTAPPVEDIVPTPNTGEEAIPYLIGAVACALSGFGIFSAAFRRKREE